MAKFDRKAQQLKARVQFVRGSVQKSKGATLTDEEADTMTDAQVEDEITFGNLEAFDREGEKPANDPETKTEPEAGKTTPAAGNGKAAK